jgi:hypothetical protein
MRRTAWLVVCTTLLVACSGGPASTSKEGGSVADKAGSADETTGPAGSGEAERGNTAAVLGEPVRVVDGDGHEIVELIVSAITPDWPCNADAATVQDPVNGHFVGVAMTVAAQPGMTEFQNPFGVFTLSTNGVFTIVGPDGVTETNEIAGGTPAYLCTTGHNELLTRPIEPGQTYDGLIILDSANAAGTLIWQPILSTDGPSPGWEWTY